MSSIAQVSLSFTGISEAEILVTLMLREWKHPLADNPEFRNALLESAAEVLRASVSGELLLAELSPDNVNLIAAIWIAENSTLDRDAAISAQERMARRAWLEAVRRGIPSCFCNPDDMP